VLNLNLYALQIKAPEEVDPVCQYDGFWEADFRSAERLAGTVGFADRVGIDQRNPQAARMAKCQQGLVEVGRPETMALPFPPQPTTRMRIGRSSS